MKVNVDKVLTDLNGKNIEDDGAHLTLKTVAVNCLLSQHPDDSRSTGEEKLKRYQLAKEIFKGGEVELTAEDASLVKRLVGRAYGPLVVGQVFPLLDG